MRRSARFLIAMASPVSCASLGHTLPGLGCDEKHFPRPRQPVEMPIEPRGANGQGQSVRQRRGGDRQLRGVAQAKRRLELLFADAGSQTGGSSGTAQNVRDQLAQSLNQSHGPTSKRFLDELITWLDREHLGRYT